MSKPCRSTPNILSTDGFKKIPIGTLHIIKTMQTNETSSTIVRSYPLAPMQHGMLFNSLYQPQAGVDLTHIVYDLPEIIQFQILKSAWQQCVDRHEVFRTAFQWKGVQQPIQHVYASAQLPFTFVDWLTLSSAEQTKQFNTFLREDRQQGFDFTAPPLMRCTLFKLGEQKFRFVVTFHHSIFDGRASGLILYEAFARYDAAISQTPYTATEHVPYQTYVEWLSQQDWTSAEQFWRHRLAGFEQTTPFPQDPIGEPDVHISDAAFEQKVYLSTETTAKLHTISQQHKISFNTMIQGAWGLLLAHYSNSDDVIFGSVRACRRSAFSGTEDMIGQLINSVPIRAQLTPEQSTLSWLEALSNQWRTIRPHEHAPFIKIKSWSDVPTGTPLFETTALYDHATVNTRMKSFGGKWANRDIEVFFKTESPISLYAHGGERMLLSIYYNRALYRDQTVERMLHQLELILTAFADDIKQPLGQISLLDASERHMILEVWNNTQSSLDASHCLHEHIAQLASTQPEKTAVSHHAHTLTYAQLDQQANQLAHHLIEKGVQLGTPIGICFERSVEMIVAIVAILKAGGIYVPLDPNAPAERLRLIQTDAQFPFVLADKERAGFTCPQHICWHSNHQPKFSHLPNNAPKRVSDSQQAAYLIYTSGSTGMPKGVLCHHHGVLNLLADFNGRFPLPPQSNHSLWTNITFDVSVYELFSALTTGGTLHIVPDEIRATPTSVLAWLATHHIHSAYLPPFMLADMANWLEESDNTLALQRLLVGVEPILETTLARIATQLPNATLLNGYGPTEATVCTTLFEFTAVTPQPKPTPIGRPMQNTQIYLLNKQQQPVPIGVAGELYIGGAGLAHGYWKRPFLTDQAFIPSPFINGERLYKTGDLARYLPDGNIEFIGRADFQVKVRGYRVELGEIEAVLLQHEAIKTAVVVTNKDAIGNRYLVAYLVANQPTYLSETAVRTYLQQKLPDYMVPSAFMWLDHLPLTASDKVDRQALPAITANSADKYAPPQSPTEEIVATAFATIFEREQISRHANFLQLGGHSLLATQLTSRLNQALNSELPLRLVFTHPKVSDLAQAIDAFQAEQNSETPFVISKATAPYPLSFAQQRLWFLQQLDPNDTAYNIPLALQLDGPLDVSLLEKSLNKIIERHGALRTVFAEENGEPTQKIRPYQPRPLTHINCESATESDVAALIEAEAKRPFLLHQATMRHTLLKRSATHHILLFTTHHIISDGWSHTIFTRELSTFYQTFANNLPDGLSDLGTQYIDYAKSQRGWLSGATLNKRLAYWQDKLATIPATTTFPTDYSRPTVQTHSGAHLTTTLSEALSRDLRTLCQQEGATLFMGLLAGFKALVHRLTHNTDIVIGAPIANRAHLDTEWLIGFFMNTLVLRTTVDPTQSFNSLLNAVRDTTLSAYAHQELPFEKLVESLQPARDLGQTPFFQLFFNMINVPEPTSTLGDVRMTQLPWVDVSSKFDATLYVTETAVNLTFQLVYNPDLFSPERMETILAQYVALLEQVTQRPTAPIASHRLTTPNQSLPDPTAPLLPTWHTPAHEQISKQAQRTPEKTAVFDPKTQLTYAQLDQQSNQLAHYLQAQGITKGDIVAIYAERSVDLPVALLAVHKAGAAFTILDPAYPPQRLLKLIDQANPTCWLQFGTTAPTFVKELEKRPFKHTAHYQSIHLSIYPTTPPTITTQPDDLAYIAFTSGTTGQPQAIATSHLPLAHFWAWQTTHFGLTANDNFSLLAGLAHDPLLRDLFVPLFVGGTLCIPDPAHLTDGDLLASWLAECQITVSHLTPALGQILASGKTPVSTPRYAFFGGESLSKTAVSHLKTIAPNATAVNFYGTTETPQAISFFEIKTDLPKATAPIGQGRDGVQLLILTADSKLAGIGELGQIAVRTPYLANGYLNNSQQTSQKFIPNPFLPHPPEHDRLYLTGDYGRFLPDGTVEYVGRSDRQINVRGYRIELSEIETALATHPAISQAVVRLQPDEQLVAYVVAHGDAPPDRSLRIFLQTLLPSPMIPTTFVSLDAIPLTPNGKIDEAQLPSVAVETKTAVFTPPTTPTEEKVAAIWADVLKQDQISTTANFFSLGGHSLLATQIISRIRQVFAVELPLQTIFSAPTVAELAQAIEAQSKREQMALRPFPLQPDYPLSFAQQRLWILDQLESTHGGYAIGTAVLLQGPLNIPALTQSLNQIIERHETLRTHFIVKDDQPRQVIAPHQPIEINTEPLPANADLTAIADSFLQRPFNLTTGPLIRVELRQQASQRHLLLINMHHIIADGWSATVLMGELRRTYASLVDNQVWSPAELPIQYRDFAQWQRAWLTGDTIKKQTTYWQNKLGQALPITELPPDFPRPTQQTFAGAKQSVTVTAVTTQALRQLSQTHNSTLFMTLLATFKLLIHRLTQQTDLVIGTPIANRTRQETEALIGFFANTLVLRTQLDQHDSFLTLLETVRTTTLDAYANQDLPFEQLVDLLKPERDLSRSPLFQLFFNMINIDEYGDFDLPNLAAEVVENGRINAKFDLTLYLLDNGTTLQLDAVYNSDLFHPASINALLAQYTDLLTQICAKPTQALADFSLQTDSAPLPNPTEPLPSHWHIPAHVALTSVATRQPNQLALADSQTQLTYAELEAKSNQLAHYLLANGLKKGDVVAILAERSVALVVAMLATHKAGAAFALLDSAYPPQRLLKLIDQAKPTCWLQLGETVAPELADGVAKRPFMHTATYPTIQLTTYPTTPPTITTQPNDLAYIAFTSGTMGQPRAIRGTHLPLAHFWQWHSHSFNFTNSDRFAMLSGLAHDPLLRDIFTPLTLSATLYIPDLATLYNPAELSAWMAQQAITVAHLTPALGQILAGGQTAVSTLNHLFFGGEALNKSVINLVKQTAPNATCVNFYGTTETPQAIAYHTATPHQTSAITPLGRGIDGVQLLVLTPNLRLAGVGELGQIGVRSPYLAQGYSDDALTNTKFIPNPFLPNPDPTDRLYLTGDYGRFLPNGEVAFIGREDGQLNVRGYRIERGDIEAVLAKHPSVNRAVVTTHGEQLVAYVVGETAVSHDLRTHIQHQLPSYMVPNAIIPLEQLPLTPNGKIDYRALPDPTDHFTADTGRFVAPRTLTELELATIWRTLLSFDDVGIHDNFFAFGGHSLLATQLLSRIQTIFTVSVPLAHFFTAPTIAELASHIDTAQRDSAPPPIVPTDATTPQPLSFAQQRLWFLDQLDETAFNIPLTLRLRGQVDAPALTQAINIIVERHSALRTTFTMVDDVPLQEIRPFTPITLHHIDLSQLPEGDQLNRAKAIATDESRHRFNLSTDVLLRAHLMQLADDDFVLLINIHHISADGWSLGVLLEELTAVYTAITQNQPSPLAPLPIQYRDYAVWQRNWLANGILDKQLAYWEQQLAHLPDGLTLPTDRPHQPNASFNAALHRFHLSPEATKQLKALSQSAQSTLFMTLLTGFKILLYRYTVQNDIVVGTPIANRTQQAIESLIGFFVNTLVLRSDVDDDMSIDELLAQVRDMALAAYSHQDVPFEKLVEALQPNRDLSRTPFFQVMFILQNAPRTNYRLPDVTLESFALTERLAQYDLSTVMWEEGNVLQGVIEYKTALFDPNTITQFCTHFTRVLEGMVANSQQAVGALPLLTASELAQVNQRQQGANQAIEPLAVHELFEKTAVSTPIAIALETPTDTYTYADLNQRANQLAHNLQSNGIQPGDIVGILLERSAEALVALLASLKANATYLILDPAYPDERIQTMLEDAKPALLLTNNAHAAQWQPHLPIITLPIAPSASTQFTPSAPNLDAPAYLIYTSGSTGKPKGVLVSHRALTNHCQAITQAFELTSADRVLQFASLSFDVAAEELFPTWATGGTLILRPDELPHDFSAYVATHKLSVLNLPAAFWHDWVAQMVDGNTAVPPHNIRLLIVGSEKVLPKRLQQWQAIAPPHIRWLNAYGPTETTITATLYEPTADALLSSDAVPIGHPIANVSTYVLDGKQLVVPDGVIGELYIGGAGVALGYLNRPTLTATAFVTHPQSGERLYKTGDLVRRLPDGNLAFVGRADNQVKVRGFRIELGEIEAALREHEAVQDCLIIPQTLENQPTQLVAYCVMDDGVETAVSLRPFLQTRLPSYMVPSSFVLLDQFSYTPNGKIDRRALPKPESRPATAYAPPTTETEITIAAIWAEVLNKPQVGLHDNFFDLGGQSLLATQIVSRIRQALGVELPIRTLFEAPTVAQLAQNLPAMDEFDASEEALLAELLDEFDSFDFDDLENLG